MLFLCQSCPFISGQRLWGPYFRASGKTVPGLQIDLLFDRADNVLTLCEMKHCIAPAGKEIIQEVERKAELLRARFPAKTIQRVLVLHGQASRTLVGSGYFYRIIHASELL
jgi:hypothetical protein